MKEYVNRDDVQMSRNNTFHTIDEIIHIILSTHKEYMKAIKVIKEDIQYIIQLCYKVVDAILMFLEMAVNGFKKGFNNSLDIDLEYSVTE